MVNLKALNQFVHTDHFKMEGMQTVKQLARPGDWLAKVDLQDAYFSVPIQHTQTRFLRFQFQGIQYEFRCLPFGLSSAPLVFTKTLKPVVALLRELGVCCVIYLDDMLIMADSQVVLKDHTAGAIYLLEALGFTINYLKSVTEPTQEHEYLRVVLNTTTMEFKLPGEKLKKIRLEAAKMARGAEPTTARVQHPKWFHQPHYSSKEHKLRPYIRAIKTTRHSLPCQKTAGTSYNGGRQN